VFFHFFILLPVTFILQLIRQQKQKMRFSKTIKDIAHTRRTLKTLGHSASHEIIAANIMQLDKDVMAAQKLHASVYLRRGYVTEDDIEDEIISKKTDPHQLHALYFAVKNKKTGNVVATARQIFHEPAKDFKSFPLMGSAKLYPKTKKELKSYNPADCIEISGLAKASGTPSSVVLLLYRAMWHHSLKQRHKVWIMACDPSLFSRLRLLFGDAINQIGYRTPYKGADIIPAMLLPEPALGKFIRISRRKSLLFGISRKHLVGFFLEGLDNDLIPASEAGYIQKVLKK
jgi:hypothetical protein